MTLAPVSATNSIRALMPPGIQPPIVVQFNASSVPVLQLSLNSDNLNEQQLYDFGIYRVRQQLAPVPGVTLPTPAGGSGKSVAEATFNAQARDEEVPALVQDDEQPQAHDGHDDRQHDGLA